MRIISDWGIFESRLSTEDICGKYGIQNWTLNDDGSVDVDGDVDLSYRELYELPLKFGKVTGYFQCQHNNLTSLEGCPNWVGGSFRCSRNDLTSLEGCPNFVGGDFRCSRNNLTSLEGSPNWVGGYFNCSKNELTNLIGGPSFVDGEFDCRSNKLTNLEGCPEKIYGDLDCGNNDIISLEFYPTILTGALCTYNNPINEIWSIVTRNISGNNGHYLHLFDLHGPIRFEDGEWVCYIEFLYNFFEEIGIRVRLNLKNYKEV